MQCTLIQRAVNPRCIRETSSTRQVRQPTCFWKSGVNSVCDTQLQSWHVLLTLDATKRLSSTAGDIELLYCNALICGAGVLYTVQWVSCIVYCTVVDLYSVLYTVQWVRDLEPLKLCRVGGFKGGQGVTIVPVMMMIWASLRFNGDGKDYIGGGYRLGWRWRHKAPKFARARNLPKWSPACKDPLPPPFQPSSTVPGKPEKKRNNYDGWCWHTQGWC